MEKWKSGENALKRAVELWITFHLFSTVSTLRGISSGTRAAETLHRTTVGMMRLTIGKGIGRSDGDGVTQMEKKEEKNEVYVDKLSTFSTAVDRLSVDNLFADTVGV